MRPFRFGVTCNDPLPGKAWQELARRVQELGYSSLLTADHLGMPSALARAVSAADATTTLRVGSFVLNNDFHHPLRLAQEAATVDELTDGRLELGIGAGWARPEYELLGIEYEKAPARAARLDSAVHSIKRAWAGDLVYDASGLVPAVPKPVQSPHPPVLIGGQGDAVLSVAARQADIVGFTGATLVNGTLRATGASASAVAERIAFVSAVAGDRFPHIEFNARVEAVFVTDDAPAITAKIAELAGVTPEIVTETPFAFVGSHGQLVDKLYTLRERFGITYYVISDKVFESFAPVAAEVAGR